MFPLKTLHSLLWVTALLLVLPGWAESQENKYPFETMRGRLINARTQQPVVFAHVINKNTREGVLSDTSGVFVIKARRNDTLYIKSISFFPRSLPISDSLIFQVRIATVQLTEQVYELANLDLTDWGSYQQFKFRVLNGFTPNQAESFEKNKLRLQKSIASIPKTTRDLLPTASLGSPLTALYMAFSKEGKSLRRYEAAREGKQMFLQTYQKYSRQIVSEITGLKGALLDSFIMVSRPPEEFLVIANEYEITVRILDDFDKFKQGLK